MTEQTDLFERPEAPALPPGSVPVHFVDRPNLASPFKFRLYFLDRRTPGTWCRLNCATAALATRAYNAFSGAENVKQIRIEELRPLEEGQWVEPFVPCTNRERRYYTQRGF